MSYDRITKAVITRMRDERHRRGWSAEQFSERVASLGVDLPRSVIANAENGRRGYMSIEEVAGIAHALGTTVQWLMWGTGVACIPCQDNPPAGFTCNDCGRSRSIRAADKVDQAAWREQYVPKRVVA